MLILWLGAALLLVPVLYGLLPGLFSVLLGNDPLAERLADLLAGGIYLAVFGAFFALLAALPYGLALLAWSRLSRHTTFLEKNSIHVLLCTALLALPTAVIASIAFAGGFAGFPRTINWNEAARVFPLALLVPWGALLIPRLTIPSLRPGAFLKPPPRSAV